ncbi:hypothetical protein [Kitasatospora sp. NPDC008115]|uniref:hypothetical protein n=1 Tax=Kitasatospora sp. NPDC008115 TaxID=3364022 RepID=UPI0036EE571E
MTGHEFTPRDARAGEDTGEGAELTAEDREVADELRVLLQLAAPHLSAPEDRIERVLARAARTRRRRRRASLASGLAIGLTVAVLASAPALAPGPKDTALRPVAPGPSVGGAPTPSPTPTPSPGLGSGGGSAETKTVLFNALDSLVVDVPADWYDLTVRPFPGSAEPVGYLSSQRMTVPAACPDRGDAPVCVSSGALDADGVLIAVRVIREENAPGNYLGEAGAPASMPPDKGCVVWGGTQQTRAYRPFTPAKEEAVVQLTACLRQPSAETLRTLEKTFASVRPLTTPELPK